MLAWFTVADVCVNSSEGMVCAPLGFVGTELLSKDVCVNQAEAVDDRLG